MPATTGVLTDRERRTLGVVCDTLIPGLVAQEGDSRELFELTASDVRLAEAVEEAMAGLGPRRLDQLRMFLRLLESRLFMWMVTGRGSGLGRLDTRQREMAMQSMATSRWARVRTGFQALKRLSTFLFYSVTDGGRANPSWKTLGYAVPRPKPARAALDVLRIPQPATFEADVCVIGSGAAGGVVAARLAAAGRAVVVLEAGQPDQASDFDQHEIVGMQRLYHERGTTATRDLGVAILAASAVGGGTTVNWQTSLRTPDYIRDEWAERSGIRTFVSDAFTQALDAVSARISVGTAESRRNANNTCLERGCTALGYPAIESARNAHGCDHTQCGYCVFGCRVGGKQSTAATYLVDAQSNGHTSIVARCRAQRLHLDGGRVAGVEAMAFADDGSSHTVRVNARTVVVAAGALETPAFLQRSGVAHKELGRNLYLHPTTAVAGRYAEAVRAWIGPPQTVLCDQFSRRRGNFGYRFEAAPVHPGLLALAQPWYGARDHRARMQHAAHVSAFIVLTRDRRPGRVSVGRDGRTVIDYRVGRLERQLLQEGLARAARLHWAGGADEIHTLHATEHTFRRSSKGRAGDIDRYCATVEKLPVGANRCALFSAHQMGTARMGRDRKANVCDERGQVFGMPGLYVADTSLFPASCGVNPMLTAMALAQLVADGIAQNAE